MSRGVDPFDMRPCYLCTSCGHELREDFSEGMSVLICDACKLLFGDPNDPDADAKISRYARSVNQENEIEFTPARDGDLTLN